MQRGCSSHALLELCREAVLGMVKDTSGILAVELSSYPFLSEVCRETQVVAGERQGRCAQFVL